MKTPKQIALAVLASALVSGSLLIPNIAQAHCQIPCGIYDDFARVKGMLEDAATVTKSMNEMEALQGQPDVQSRQQFVRWTMNKEEHAQYIIETISNYFLTQRVNDSQKDYVQRLKDHHAVIVAAMKAKQNADLEYAATLTETINVLKRYYPDEHKH